MPKTTGRHTRRQVKKPSCEKFIIEAIRQTRGTRRGIALRRIFIRARHFYNKKEFHESLQKLVTKGVVLMLAKVTGRPDSNIFKIQEKATKLPTHIPANGKCWWAVDNKGNEVDYDDPNMVMQCRDPILYVVEDGLPKTVLADISRGKEQGEKIMSSLR